MCIQGTVIIFLFNDLACGQIIVCIMKELYLVYRDDLNSLGIKWNKSIYSFLIKMLLSED